METSTPLNPSLKTEIENVLRLIEILFYNEF